MKISPIPIPLSCFSYFLIAIISLLLPFFSPVYAQGIEASFLSELSARAEAIIEGEIISQEQCVSDGIPYRIFEIKPLKVFKGESTDNISLIQVGGMVDSTLFMSFHQAYLKSGEQGIYFVSGIGENKLNCPDLSNQFTLLDVAKYYDDGINPQIVLSDQKTTNYERFINSLVDPEHPPKILAASIHEERMGIQFLKNNSTPNNLGGETSIEYSFKNPFYDYLAKVFSFDVHAKLTGDNIAFGEGIVTINYDTLLLGSNLVSKGLVNITKGNDISGSTYSLVTSDYSASAIQIAISGPCDPSSPGTPGGKTPKDLHLLHVETVDPPITASSPISFDEFSMSDQSQYIDDQGDCFPFDHYIIDDSITIIENNGGVGICMILDNFSYEDLGNKKFLHFSLFAQQTGELPGNLIYFGATTVHVDYSDMAFGTNVVNGMALSANTAGFTDPNYEITLADVGSTTFEIHLERMDQSFPVVMNSGVLHKMGDFTLEVAGCLNVAGISPFLPAATPSGFTAAAPGADPILNGTPMAYNPQTAKEDYNGLTCNTVMRIDQFTPSVPAGDNEESRMIIQGVGFNNGIPPGNNAIGKVYFPNADNGGASYTYTHVSDIEKWSDSEIILYVPSVIGDDCPNVTGTETVERGSSGSGKFIIEAPEDNGMLSRIESVDALNIPYAIINYRSALFDDCGAVRLHLTKDNEKPFNNEGYEFHMSNSAAMADPNLAQCMADVFCEWNAVNDIKFVMNSVATGLSPPNIADGFNGILYSPLSLGSTTLAFTVNTGGARVNADPNCLGNGYFKDRPLVTVKEVDILINENAFSPLDCSMDPLWWPTLLHEVGHALTLDHVLPGNQLMFWTAGNLNIGIGANEITGSIDVADNSQELHASCSDQPIITGMLNDCLTTGFSEPGIITQLKISPNIFKSGNNFNLTAEGAINHLDDIRLYNARGEMIPTNSKVQFSKISITTSQFLSSGFYLLQFYRDQKLITTHKIIIQ